MGILISFLNLLLYIAIIVFIAFVIVWVIQSFMGWAIDANVMKWGKVIVGLLCLIAVVMWLAGVLGAAPASPTFGATDKRQSQLDALPPAEPAPPSICKGQIPRAGQSATWEPVRELFPSKWKTAKNNAAVDDLRRAYDRGDISIDRARKAVFDLAGGIGTPEWARRGIGATAPSQGSTYR
ncbi:uncharacterized membrane protein (DUF485 family) [Bradyrhizobium sp. S3.9.2]|uniref:hypothetical protein n=1 Tax=unclassified Bradyrhizobium TaxID=2631580 RepID=UPI0033990BFA